jgi:hypothetical protein
MKVETRRRLKNVLRILNRGEIGTEVYRTGFYRQLFWDDIHYWPKSSRYGRVKLP